MSGMIVNQSAVKAFAYYLLKFWRHHSWWRARLTDKEDAAFAFLLFSYHLSLNFCQSQTHTHTCAHTQIHTHTNTHTHTRTRLTIICHLMISLDNRANKRNSSKRLANKGTQLSMNYTVGQPSIKTSKITKVSVIAVYSKCFAQEMFEQCHHHHHHSH